MDFERAKKYLESFVSYEEMVKIPYGKESFDLDRVRNFLKKYGVDYEKLKCVHVAGSKGKGSICSMIAGYLWRAGYKVGLYTSPHMVEVTERFWLNGGYISKVKFAEYVEDLKKFMERNNDSALVNLTYFEILTVIALKFFVDEGVDYAVLEVGLGGRLDATNIVRPVLSVITSVELEHVGVLGNNLSEILDEKLGIVKKSVPVLIGHQQSEAFKLIRKKLARRKGVFYVDMFFSGENFFDFSNVCCDEAKRKNARVVFAALKLIFGHVDLEIFRGIFENFKLPGRFDVREVGGWTVVFDMAHTRSSIGNLVSALRDNFPNSSFVFLFAMMKGKDTTGILNQIDGVAEKIVFTNAHSGRGIAAGDLKVVAADMDLQSSIEVIENCAEAYKSLLKNIKKNQILVITGSHFLVGKLLSELNY